MRLDYRNAYEFIEFVAPLVENWIFQAKEASFAKNADATSAGPGQDARPTSCRPCRREVRRLAKKVQAYQYR